MRNKKKLGRNRQPRKGNLLVLFAFVILLVIGVGAVLNPETRKAIKRPDVPEEMRAESSSKKVELTDDDRDALEDAFNRTMERDCDGYVLKWKSYTEDYGVFELTFIQEVAEMTDAEKQTLMDKTGKLFDSQRQHYFGAGNYMKITFITEDGKKFGASKMLFPEQYKLV